MVTRKQLRNVGRAYETAEPVIKALNANGINIYRFDRKHYYLWDGRDVVYLDDRKALAEFLVNNEYLREEQTKQWYVIGIIVARLKPCAQVVYSYAYQSTSIINHIRTVSSGDRSQKVRMCVRKIIEYLKGKENDSN